MHLYAVADELTYTFVSDSKGQVFLEWNEILVDLNFPNTEKNDKFLQRFWIYRQFVIIDILRNKPYLLTMAQKKKKRLVSKETKHLFISPDSKTNSTEDKTKQEKQNKTLCIFYFLFAYYILFAQYLQGVSTRYVTL